jgi:DNA-binding transcriptional LysR family regulator
MAGLRSLDLNLLIVFDAVVETRSITAAAERVGLSQSAVSHAIGRLRESLGDQLFVRSRHGLTPTPGAQKLLPSVKQALELLEAALSEPRTFEPGRSAQAFRIAIPHPLGPFIALRLQEVMASRAPRIRLGFDTRTLPIDLPDDLREGRIDLAIDWLPAGELDFVNQPLFNDRLMLLIRDGHPSFTPKPSVAWLQAQRFVAIHDRAPPSARPEAVRRLLDYARWTIALRVSEFLEIPTVVAATNLVGIFPGSGASVIARLRELRMLELPIELPKVPILLTWHSARRKELAHTWLRRTVHEVIRRFAVDEPSISVSPRPAAPIPVPARDTPPPPRRSAAARRRGSAGLLGQYTGHLRLCGSSK